jgi:ATPase subunit of ABC transporter with duplicated ATPase domains
LSNTGVDQVAVHDAERHLKYIKDQNVDSFKETVEEKRKQSQRAKEKNEAKRKAEQTAAFGQGPKKKGIADPVAETIPKVEAASSSASARAWLDDPQAASGDRQYTGSG